MEKETTTPRLQSLKLPRDLTLGFNKSKKQYVPNLNVVRNKDKTKEIIKKVDERRRNKVNHRDKPGRNDVKQRYHQSAGVFSQGTAETVRSNNHVEKRVGLRENGTVSNIVMPTINRNSWVVNKKAEDVVLQELTHSDHESDDEKMSFAPLTLSDTWKKPKREVIKKEEPTDFFTDLPEPFNSSLHTDESPSLSIIKLPESFAGKGLSDDPNVKTLFDYPLSSMNEGQIGKMIVRKSGRIQFQIGRIQYDLAQENTFEAKEEIAALAQNESGDYCITVLGNVANNFILSPDYHSLVKK